MRNFLHATSLLFLISMSSCQSQPAQHNYSHSTHFPYDISSSKEYSMPKSLLEISGMTFIPGNDAQVYAIQDEDGTLFTYDLAQDKIVAEADFGKKGDYEEITTDGKYFYVLRSDGNIYSFATAKSPEKDKVKQHKDLLPKGEYESMAYDSDSHSLFVLCKECIVDKKGKSLSGYRIQIESNGELSVAGNFSLANDALQQLDKNLKKTPKPSAMARRQQSKEWYILSSIDLAIIVTDDAFHPKEVIPLKRKEFAQPEGICFDSTGNLYISSEAGKTKHGKIYAFKFLR